MDKNEYRAKLDEINDLVDRQDYRGALQIVDTIDWRRVRSARTLCMVGEIYEANKRYDESRKLLLMAHQRAPIGRTVLYRLVELSVKMGNFDEAADYYKQFVEISPNDNSRYILKYKLSRAKRASLEEQISILQEYKSREYTERWAYELARLYAKAGKKEACIEECDDLILWFSEGKYVTKAMELKMKYTPLTPIQQDKYNHRFQKGYAPAAAVKAVNAASQAAEKVVKASGAAAKSYSGDIEEIIRSVAGEEAVQPGDAQRAPEIQPEAPDTEELKDKAVQDIMDVLPGKNEGIEETAAAREDSEKKGYVVKDLEPESIGSPSGFRQFHMQGVMNTTVKVQAPKSQLFKEEDMNPDDFKTNFKEKELDLEALLAETANELAQAVAEDTEKTEQEQGAQEVQETEEESVSNELQPEGVEEETVQEDTPETVENQEMPAPAAAKAAMVADAIASALMEKAEEFEKDAQKVQEALGNTREFVTEEIIGTEDGVPVVEAVEEAAFEESPVSETAEEEKLKEIPELEEPGVFAEPADEIPDEKKDETEEADNIEEVPEIEEIQEIEEIPETAETLQDGQPAELGEPEASVQEIEELPEEIGEDFPETSKETAEEESGDDVQEELEEIPVELQETKILPETEVKEALGEIDLSSALEQALSESTNPEEGTQEATVYGTEEEKAVQEAQPAAFSTALEGLMRHHLTEEEHRRLFTYFAPVPGMSQQINEALDTAQESACAKTSQSGNIIVTGREGSGKTKLSEGLIKALCKERQMQGAKVAYLKAEELNKKNPAAVVDKLSGGFLVIENGGELDQDIVENLSKAMEFKTNRLTVILEDLKPGIRSLEEKYPEFMAKFDSRIVIPVFTNDELVSFAKTYAKELGYKIDDMAVLALYTLIGDNQNEENPVSIAMVREMMDEALKKAGKKGRRPGKRVGKRHLDESGRIMLYEKDFDI